MRDQWIWCNNYNDLRSHAEFLTGKGSLKKKISPVHRSQWKRTKLHKRRGQIVASSAWNLPYRSSLELTRSRKVLFHIKYLSNFNPAWTSKNLQKHSPKMQQQRGRSSHRAAHLPPHRLLNMSGRCNNQGLVVEVWWWKERVTITARLGCQHAMSR